MEFFYIDRYDIFTIGFYIIGFDVKIISELVFTMILYPFLLHILLEGKYSSIFTCNFFHKLSTESITIEKKKILQGKSKGIFFEN